VTTARLNRVIDALAAGRHVFASFASADPATAVEFSTTDYDGLVFEMEHKPWDVTALRDSLQFLLSRRQIHAADSLAPAVTPLVRIPANGAENAQWLAKQALDLGVFGIVWPHIATVEEARNAVAACRYPRLPEAPRYEPAGLRGDGPHAAVRYWGLPNTEYYARADVWPLDPAGEILVAIMIEDQRGIENLPAILDEVPGIGLVLIGEGDLCQDLGHPREYEHPEVEAAIRDVVEICKSAGVPAGIPHVTPGNVVARLEQGFSWLMPNPTRMNQAVDIGQKWLADNKAGASK